MTTKKTKEDYDALCNQLEQAVRYWDEATRYAIKERESLGLLVERKYELICGTVGFNVFLLVISFTAIIHKAVEDGGAVGIAIFIWIFIGSIMTLRQMWDDWVIGGNTE